MEAYDYLVINDDLATVKEMHEIIQGEHRRVSRNTELVEQIKTQLKDYVKGE